jgi:single-strand DNA-binding protein
MPDLNRVMLLGNLTRDPELKTTPKGTAVTDLAIAVNESYKAQDGSIVKETLYVDVEVWGRQAETCCQYLHKGDPVFVEARLRLEQWQTKEGENRRMLKVRGDRVQFLRGSSTGGGGGGGQQRSSFGGGEDRSSGMSTRESRPAPKPASRPAPPVDDGPPPTEEDDIPF